MKALLFSCRRRTTLRQTVRDGRVIFIEEIRLLRSHESTAIRQAQSGPRTYRYGDRKQYRLWLALKAFKVYCLDEE